MDMNKEQMIEQHLSILQPAYKRWAQGDPMGYAELLAEEVSYFDPRTNGQILRKEDVKQHLKPITGLVQVPKYEFSNIELQVIGEYRILSYLWKEFDDQGKPMNTWNCSEVWSQIDGQWQIIHCHFSMIPVMKD